MNCQVCKVIKYVIIKDMLIRKFKINKILILLCFFVFFVMSGFQCKLETSEIKDAMKPISLEWWGVFDDNSSLESIIKSYKIIHPNISIKYKKFRYNEYKGKL
ncbi:hypothetical protein ACFL2L_00750, partial [Patescibacteria group bacterium]